MTVGSSYSDVKATLSDLLAARAGFHGVKVLYDEPTKPEDLQTSNRSQEAVWFGDPDGTGVIEVTTFNGTPLTFTERYPLALIVQVLRPTSDGTQRAVDARANELVFEVLDQLAADPTLALTGVLFVVPSAMEWTTGFLATGAGHGARCELTLDVHARRSF